jgi:hypothetical protein
MFLPIVLSFWLVFWLTLPRQSVSRNTFTLLRFGAPIFLGLQIPFIGALIYFARHEVLELALWTWFEYPIHLLREVPPDVSQLKRGLKWFLVNFAPVMAFALVGISGSRARKRDFVTLNLMLWSVLGLVVILLQRLSWWPYHYMLLVVPLGLLATRGVDSLWPHAQQILRPTGTWQSRVIFALTLILLFWPITSALVFKGVSIGRHGFALSKQQRFEYQAQVYPRYGRLSKEAAFLSEPTNLPGDIYVFGNTLYYYFSGRDPAIPLLTWFRPLPEQWIQLLDALDESRPPYVFVGTYAFDEFRTTPRLLPYLEQTIPRVEKHYETFRTTKEGTWYMRRDR